MARQPDGAPPGQAGEPPPAAPTARQVGDRRGREADAAANSRRARWPRRASRPLRKIPVDRAKYETVRTLDASTRWIARARDVGHVALDTETTSLDPMQAELCGFSLARRAQRGLLHAARPPQGGDGADLFAGGRAPDQIEERDALDALKPLLEAAGVLKIGQNVKFDRLIFARHGIDLAPIDDTMLMSYVLDAGRGAHGMDELSERWLGHQTIHYGDVAGTGKAQAQLRPGARSTRRPSMPPRTPT